MLSVLMPYYMRRAYFLNTMASYEHFYADKDIEVLVFDDGSMPEGACSYKPGDYSFPVRIYSWKSPAGKGDNVNPCVLYNFLAWQARGDILMLTSPEIMHIKNIFETTNNFKDINDKSYGVCSCWHSFVPDQFLSYSIEDKLNIIRTASPLTCRRDDQIAHLFWHQHSVYNNRRFHFCTLITKELYYQMRGFDERYRLGVSYDDCEFVRRLDEEYKVEFVYYDSFNALHIDHEHSPRQLVPGLSERNMYLYQADVERHIYHCNGPGWGILEAEEVC